jgi:hypothetical protein
MLTHRLYGMLRKIKYNLQRPVIVEAQGRLAPGNGPTTFVVIVGPHFDQTIPNAGTTCRMGWCRGFEQFGIPYLIVSIFDLARRLPDIPNPVCWLSGADYEYLNPHNLTTIKRYPHAVWVNTWFEGDAEFYQKNNFENNSWPTMLNRKILSSEPALLFTISPESRFEYYEGWLKSGAHLVSLPLACDTTLYNANTPACSEFEHIEMAFVGGYWPYKARQFDRYLKPYADRLRVYGYSPWPYAGYGGRLEEVKEPSLYRQARLSPTINEPHVEQMGVDLNERVFKVLGSGGMTVTDVTPAYREWFSADELLVPGNLDQYHELVAQALGDDDFNQRYRQAGNAAVQARHTYAHRAQKLLEILGIELPRS